MGWTFSESWQNKKELVAYLRSAERQGPNYEVLASSVVGNHHWYLAKNLVKGDVIIGLDLMQAGTRAGPHRKPSGWGYKDMDESVGPCYHDCPISYLNSVSPPINQYSADWRKELVAAHQRKKQVSDIRKTVAPGLLVDYGGVSYKLERSLGRKGWQVSDTRGTIYRLKASQLASALRNLRVTEANHGA